MAKRKLRIVRDHPLLGICEYCNIQFSSGLMPIEQAKDDIQERFNVHKCKREARRERFQAIPGALLRRAVRHGHSP